MHALKNLLTVVIYFDLLEKKKSASMHGVNPERLAFFSPHCAEVGCEN